MLSWDVYIFFFIWLIEIFSLQDSAKEVKGLLMNEQEDKVMIPFW